eukprot:g12578.t2
MPDTAELFRHDVPVLRTSLARHGLVDASTSPRARRPSIGPPSSEDLSSADRGDEQWGAAAGTVSGAGGGGGGGSGSVRGAGFQALVGVDSVVVGHVRAAEELRATLLYPPAPKKPLKAQELPATGTTPRGNQSTSTTTQTHRGQRSRDRHSSSGTFSSPPPAASLRRQRANSAASLAAASAMAAVRKGDRPFYLGAARTTSRGGGASLDQTPHTTSGVSMANLLDIAVSLFGGAGSGGTKTVGNSNGADGRRNTGEKLVTFTVDVHTGSSTTLGITVKELGGGAVYVEDVRKLDKGCSGPAELAGILVGDVILGINYKPLEKGLVHTSTLLAEAISLAGFVKLQISRAVRSNSWRSSLPSLPGKDCPIVTELMWRIAQLRKAGAERHTMAELVLQRMAWEEGTLTGPPPARAPFSSPTALPQDYPASDLLDALVLRVKSLREAISVRCLYAKSTIETVEVPSVWDPPSSSLEEAVSGASAARPEGSTAPGTLVTVRYVLRAEDIGTGREWLVFPQFTDFSELRQQLLLMWPPIADLPFPAKRPVPRAMSSESTPGAAEFAREAVVEDGVVRLEAFLEGAMALLGIYVSIDPRCSGVLRLIQDFLGRPKDLVADEMVLTPALCDQKRAELLLYKLLNQVDSPAARLKILLMRDFENEASLAPDMQSLMKGASSRLRRLQDFILEQHEEQLSASSYATGEEKEVTMRKAVRRQVELSFYLPLRRCLWKELTRRLQGPARKLSRAIQVLRCSSPSVFGVESTGIFGSTEWGPAKESMAQATRRVLPTDQIDGLRRAAEHIAVLHASLQQNATDVEGEGQGENEEVDDGVGEPETTTLAALSVVDNPRRSADPALRLHGNIGETECESDGKGEEESHSVIEASLGSKLNDVGHNWRAPASLEEVRSPETSPASSAGTVATVVDCEQDDRHGVGEAVASAVRTGSDEAMGADDFLPLFSLVLVHSAPLDLLLPQTLLTHLMDADGSLSEAGYLVATLEAAVSFITQVYASTCSPDHKREIEIYLTNVGAEGEGRRTGGGPRPKKRPLGLLCTGVNDAILEMCVENKGRPLARALTDFVEYAIEALASGYSVEALLLELQLLDSTTRVPGQTLTGVEKRYRTQWITAMHAVMQHLEYVEQQEPKSAEDFHIKSQVGVVLRGRQTNDEQTFVKFDKALATGGVAGGVATERIVVSPQMVPISQLTLLAIRALQKLEDATAIGNNAADGEPSAEEFGARAQFLASKYHDLRFNGAGGVRERKRLSREVQRQQVQVDDDDDDDDGQNGDRRAVTASALGHGLGGRADPGPTGLASEAGGVVSDRGGDTPVQHATHEESQQRQFVYRCEMAGFARELGYDVTPEQATGIFDMLDSERQGRIPRDDIFNHFLPLLHSAGSSGPPRKGSKGRRKSSNGGDENRSCRDDSVQKLKKVGKVGETTSEEVVGEKEALIAVQGGTDEELELATGVSEMKKRSGGADHGSSDGAAEGETVKQSVGQGAFGEVYQVVWTGIGADRGATLAMKTTRLADINSNERDEYRVLLMEEILTAVRVKAHPNVVNVRFAHIMGFCSESEEYFCFEDFVTGRNLEELVGEGQGELYNGTSAEVQGRLLSYSIQLARGLGHIHRCGVLHQDIKSANIMVSSDAETLITDFGFATVGRFGPPLPSTQKPGSIPSMVNTADGASFITDGVPNRSCTAGEAPVAPATSTTQAQQATVANSTNSASSAPIGVGEGRLDNGGARKETSAREAQGSDSNIAGIRRPPNRDSVLYGTIQGYTRRQDTQLNEAAGGEGARATSQDGEQPQAKGASGSGSLRGNDGTKKRITFRVNMPEGVLAVLRDIFQQEAGDRPESMEVLAARLSRTLANMLGDNLAVVPCATTGAPSISSLCEESPACLECEDNHAKVGRLHMWLGKALFLKGEDRREQALQEYREGVRVLAQSKAELRSPSMALFRWYLGKALLETGEIDEALPHLTEAVSIDPESAKYRHTLGLAKCATGDEAGAREDLLEATLLDEEDAEDRYQLRMQRINEKRRNDEQQRRLPESQASDGVDAPQGASSSESGDTETGDAQKAQQATTPTKNYSPDPISTLSQSQLVALEKASVSTRTYALGNLSDYRTDRGVGRGGGDYFRRGLGSTMDGRGSYVGDKSVRDAAALPEIRRFSIGDEVCQAPTFTLQNSFEHLRCCRSSYRIETDFEDDSNEIFIVDGLVPPDQASLDFPGEVYATTGVTMERRRRTSGEISDSDVGRTFHAVYIRFEPDKNRPVAATGTVPKEEENNFATLNGHKQLAPIDERQLTKQGADATTNRNPIGVMAAPTTGASAGSTSTSTSTSSNKPRGSLSPSRPVSPTNAFSLRGQTLVQRDEEYVPMLKAAGRAAMVGFHAQLAGAMRHLTWGSGELILVADSIPSPCFTLWEACASGNLYRGTGNISPDGGRSRPKPSEDKAIDSSVVVNRMLELARQTAEAISHCHKNGVCLCGRGLVDEAERYYKMALLSSEDVVEAYYNLGLLYIAPAFNKFHEARQVFDAATERMGNKDPRRSASIEHSKAAERKSNYHQSQEMMKALSGKYSGVFPKG